MNTQLTEQPEADYEPGSLEARRKELREKLLIGAVLEGQDLIIEGEMDGYGDSGTIDIHTDDEDVEQFLEDMIQRHVTFDWYNNEGGGGTIEWNVRTDEITINGYQNVVQQDYIMEDEVF